MYQIQSDKLNYFEQQINNPNRKITYKFTLNDEPLEASQIMDNPTLTTDTGLDQYGVGCALVTQLQMSVKSDVLIIPKDEITIQIGMEIYNEVTQEWETIYTPMGVFYVDTLEEKGIKKSIKAYDGMYKLNKGYFPTAKHTTTQAIANDIATANGYKVKGVTGVSINNEQIEGKTTIEMLSLVASAIGGHVRISRDGSTIEFIEPTNHGLVFDESDYTTPTLDDATTYNITKLRVNYSDQVTNDEGEVTDEGYYTVGSGTDAQTLELGNPLLKDKASQATNILNKIKQLNGYKRFDTTMPLGDFRLDTMDLITYSKGEVEYIVPILYLKMTLSYQGIGMEIQSPTLAETKSEFSFKGTLTQKVENIYTDIIQVKELTANKVTTDELEATVATIEKLYATKAEIGELVAGSIVVEDLKAQIAEIDKAIINKAEISDLNALDATINSLKAQVAEIDNLIADSILSEIIQSGSISSDLLNVKDGFIKDAMISSLSASKINTGVINTNNVSIQSENGNMLLQGNLLQFKDKNGKVRIQIGQDTTGNYTFTLYDSTGKGVLINQDGIQSSDAIKDGLIVDSKVADNANISGSKLNISSVYDEMNADGSKTLKASKVHLDDKGQTLDVSFKEMTTKTDKLEDTMTTAITDIEVSQGQISQLIQDTTITTANGTTTLKDAFGKVEQTVNGHTTQIGNMESTLVNQGNGISDLTNRMTSAESKITDTEITNTVKKNFYTKEETENAITTKGYATSTELQQTATDFTYKFSQSGGYNFVRNSNAKNGQSYWQVYYLPEANWGIRNDEWTGYETAFQINAPNGTTTINAIYQAVDGLIAGETYAFSALTATHRGANQIVIANREGTVQLGQSDLVTNCEGGTNISGWKRISGTFIATSSTCQLRLCHYLGSANSFAWFKQVQINRGSIALPHSSHPNEVYDGITTIDKDGITVSTSRGAYTQFSSEGMASFNNDGTQTLGIRNGGITFHPFNTNQLGAYITQSSLWGGSAAANGLAISTANNGTYIALGTSSLSDANTSLNMEQALTISASDGFQPRGINFWKDVHAHGYGIRQLSHLHLAGSGAIQFDYLNNSPSTIYEAVDSGHSLYVMGGYQMHLGVMEGGGTPHGVIWMKGKTDTHSYTHWDFHNYTMYNMKTASTFANTYSRKFTESYGVTSNVDGIRYLYRDVELINGKAIRSIPLVYSGATYDIVSIVCKGRGGAWVEKEDENRFEIQGDCKSVNVEIIIYPSESVMMISAVNTTEAPVLELPKEATPEIAQPLTNVGIESFDFWNQYMHSKYS